MLRDCEIKNLRSNIAIALQRLRIIFPGGKEDASVKRADKIVVLSDETIEACGTHEQLMQTSKVYKDIYDSQIGKDELAYE